MRVSAFHLDEDVVNYLSNSMFISESGKEGSKEKKMFMSASVCLQGFQRPYGIKGLGA